MSRTRRLSLAGALLAAGAVGLYLLLPGGSGGVREGQGPARPVAARPTARAAAPAPSAPLPAPAPAPPADAEGPRLTARQVAAIDPERDVQRWAEAVESFQGRMARFFGKEGSPGAAQRREEGEELLLLVDAFDAKGFYLPGQGSQAKLEIVRQIYGDDPELLAKLTAEYEAERNRQLVQRAEQQQRELEDDPRFQSYKACEQRVIDETARTMQPGPERDTAIAQAASRCHAQIYGDPGGP